MIRTPSLQLLQMIAKLIDGMFQLSTGDDNFCSWKEKARTWQNYTRHKKASHQSLPAQHFTATATIHTTQTLYCNSYHTHNTTLYCNSYHTHNTLLQQLPYTQHNHFTATATIHTTQTLYCNSYHTHNTTLYCNSYHTHTTNTLLQQLPYTQRNTLLQQLT